MANYVLACRPFSACTRLECSSRYVARAMGFDSILAWDVTTGTRVDGMPRIEYNGYIDNLAICERYLGLCARDGKVSVFDLESKERVLFLDQEINSLAFLPDGQTLVASHATTVNGYTLIVNIPSGEQQKMENIYGYDIHVSPSGRWLTISDTSYDTHPSQYLQCRDMKNGTNVALTVDQKALGFAQFNRREYYVGIGKFGGVMVWDIEELINQPDKPDQAQYWYRQQVNLCPIARTDICSAAVNGHILAIGSYWGQIHFWNLQQFHPMCSLDTHKHPVKQLAFTPDGQQLASADEKGTVFLWDAQTYRF